MDDTFDLSGRTALITGGAGDLGWAIAQSLAKHGARVIIADVDSDRLTTLQAESGIDGFHVHTYLVDVTDNPAVQAMVHALVDQFGRLDILVNAVGTTFNTSAIEFPETQFDRIMAINLKGPFLTCQHVGRVMIKQGYGRVINIASIAGQVAHHPRSSVYAMSKAAMIQLSRNLAVEWATHGVLVNAIAPAYFRTRLTVPAFSDRDFYQRHVVERTPLGRPGEPDELVGAVLLLASDAGSYITGTTINVDGGWIAI